MSGRRKLRYPTLGDLVAVCKAAPVVVFERVPASACGGLASMGPGSISLQQAPHRSVFFDRHDPRADEGYRKAKDNE
jgi:hypothetical protein